MTAANAPRPTRPEAYGEFSDRITATGEGPTQKRRKIVRNRSGFRRPPTVSPLGTRLGTGDRIGIAQGAQKLNEVTLTSSAHVQLARQRVDLIAGRPAGSSLVLRPRRRARPGR